MLRKLAALTLFLLIPCLALAGTKSLTGKLRSVKDNVLVIQTKGLVSTGSLVEIEKDEATKITGQLVPGMHVKVKYREEPAAGGSGPKRKVAVEIDARPEYASKQAREAAKQTNP